MGLFSVPTETHLLKSSLIGIEVFPSEIDNYYHFKKEIKFMGLIVRKRGYYTYMDRFEGSALPEDYQSTCGVINQKPHIKLLFPSNHSKTIWFKSDREMNEYVTKLKKSKDWI